MATAGVVSCLPTIRRQRLRVAFCEPSLHPCLGLRVDKAGSRIGQIGSKHLNVAARLTNHNEPLWIIPWGLPTKHRVRLAVRRLCISVLQSVDYNFVLALRAEEASMADFQTYCMPSSLHD